MKIQQIDQYKMYDGIHINYTEIDKNGYGKNHKVLIKDREFWHELCQKYPI